MNNNNKNEILRIFFSDLDLFADQISFPAGEIATDDTRAVVLENQGISSDDDLAYMIRIRDRFEFLHTHGVVIVFVSANTVKNIKYFMRRAKIPDEWIAATLSQTETISQSGEKIEKWQLIAEWCASQGWSTEVLHNASIVFGDDNHKEILKMRESSMGEFITCVEGWRPPKKNDGGRYTHAEGFAAFGRRSGIANPVPGNEISTTICRLLLEEELQTSGGMNKEEATDYFTMGGKYPGVYNHGEEEEPTIKDINMSWKKSAISRSKNLCHENIQKKCKRGPSVSSGFLVPVMGPDAVNKWLLEMKPIDLYRTLLFFFDPSADIDDEVAMMYVANRNKHKQVWVIAGNKNETGKERLVGFMNEFKGVFSTIPQIITIIALEDLKVVLCSNQCMDASTGGPITFCFKSGIVCAPVGDTPDGWYTNLTFADQLFLQGSPDKGFNTNDSKQFLEHFKGFNYVSSPFCMKAKPTGTLLKHLPDPYPQKILTLAFNFLTGRMPPDNAYAMYAEGLVNPAVGSAVNMKALMTFCEAVGVSYDNVTILSKHTKLAQKYFTDLKAQDVQLKMEVDSTKCLAKMCAALEMVMPGIWVNREEVYYSSASIPEELSGYFQQFIRLAKSCEGEIAGSNPLYDLVAVTIITVGDWEDTPEGWATVYQHWIEAFAGIGAIPFVVTVEGERAFRLQPPPPKIQLHL